MKSGRYNMSLFSLKSQGQVPEGNIVLHNM